MTTLTEQQKRELEMAAPSGQQQPLPVQPGEREALTSQYVGAGYSPEQAATRVNQLWAGRPEAQPSQPAPQQDMGTGFQTAMQSLVKGYQGGAAPTTTAVPGSTVEDLINQRNRLVEARFRARADFTPEELRRLTPAQQEALRRGDVSGLQTQLGGVESSLGYLSSEREGEMKREAIRRKEELAAQQQKEEKYGPIEVGGSLLQLNPQTGKYDVVYQSPTASKLMEVSPGTTLYDPATGQVVYQAPQTSATVSPSTTQSTVNQIVGAFDNEPVVRNFTVSAGGYQTMQNISNNTTNPADDIAMIYQFAKIMDPNSVVREGEYATVQRYAQSWAESFGFNAARTFSNTKFLTSEAIANMKASAAAKYRADYAAYINLQNEYNRRIEEAKRGGITGSISDYAAGYSVTGESPGGSAEPTSSGQLFDFRNDLSMSLKGGEIKKIATAIGQFESGGNYRAVGPTTKSGDRAYGKYQVMGNNIPSWTKEATGRSYTTKQFVNDPKLQDRVAEYKMAQYYKKYGTLEDVASVWFSGRPVKKAGGAKDILGTSVPQYIKNVRKYYNALG